MTTRDENGIVLKSMGSRQKDLPRYWLIKNQRALYAKLPLSRKFA